MPKTLHWSIKLEQEKHGRETHELDVENGARVLRDLNARVLGGCEHLDPGIEELLGGWLPVKARDNIRIANQLWIWAHFVPILLLDRKRRLGVPCY